MWLLLKDHKDKRMNQSGKRRGEQDSRVKTEQGRQTGERRQRVCSRQGLWVGAPQPPAHFHSQEGCCNNRTSLHVVKPTALLETLISFHSFCASQAGNLEEGECAVSTHWAPVSPEVPWGRLHSPRCGPCWRLPSAPAARLGSSSVRLAGPGPTTTRRSAGSGERRRGPSVHCGPARTGLSYPSGPPGAGGRSKGRHSWASLCHSNPHVLWTNSIPPQMYGVRVPLCVSGESLSELLQLMHCSRPQVPSVELVITRHPPSSLCLSRKWPGASSSLGSRYEGRQNLFCPTLVTWVKYP